MQLVDTHCHIQFDGFGISPQEAIKNALSVGVVNFIAVGCELNDSKQAIELANQDKRVFASIGLHPHEGAKYAHDEQALADFKQLVKEKRVVAIGETGLDYFYMNSPKDDQIKLLRLQLQLAQDNNLPVILHIREAFDDFWPIFDEFEGLRGVVHSFSSTISDLNQILSRGLYVGLNGIMTFTKKPEQLEAAKAVPLDSLLLETDAPFLTPAPYRGKMCEPKHVSVTAEFLAKLRDEDLEELAETTTNNARKLFNLK